MEAVADRSFLLGWAKENDSIYEELKSRIDTTVLNVMKNYLRENHVDFDGSSIDLQEFKKSVVSELPEAQQLALTKLEKDINKELTELTEALHEGSQTAFTAVTEKLGDFGKMALKMTARASAMKVAYVLNPTLGGVALASSIAIPAVVKGGKDFKTKQEESRQAALDAVLLKLLATKDEERNEISYSVPPNIMVAVEENMKNEGIIIDTSDTIKFIRDVAGLDLEKKEIAIKIINNLKGNPIDYNTEVKDLNTKINNVKKVLKDDVVSPLSTAAMVGLNIGNSFATWDPDISASVITALGTGLVTGDLTSATLVGGSQLAVSKGAQLLPDAIGDVVQNLNELETMAGATGIVLGGALLLKVVPTLAKHGFIAAKNYIQTKTEYHKNKDGLSEQEKEKLKEKIDENLRLTAKEIEGKNAREIALGIVADALRAKGIEIDNKIVSKDELKKYTQRLNNEDKKDIREIVEVLEKTEELNENQLKKTLSGLTQTAYWGGVIALAGLGAYDAFLNPGFIEGLVAREPYGIEQEQLTLSEQLDSIKKEIKEIPEKVKNIPKTIEEAVSDPKSFIEKRKRLSQNASEMSENQENEIEFAEQDYIDPYAEKIEQQRKAEQIAADRLKNAEESFSETILDIKQELPHSQEEATLIKDSTVPRGVFKGSTYGHNPGLQHSNMNDIVIHGLNLDTEEGLCKFLQEIGENDEDIQKLLEETGAKTITELVKKSDIRNAVEQLGGAEYFDEPQWWNDMFIGKDYKEQIMNLINKRSLEVLGEIPTQAATEEEIIEFLGGFVEENGNIIEEKVKYYSLFQQAKEITDNGNIGELIKKHIRNIDTIEESDEYLEYIKKSLQDSLVAQEELNRQREIQELTNQIKKMEDGQEIIDTVKETEEGFIDGLESKITSDPLDIAKEGAKVGLGVGVANEIRKGLFGKIGDFFKGIFGNKPKALPSADEEKKNKSNLSESQSTEETLDDYVKVRKEELKPLEKGKKKKITKDKEK